MTRVFKFILLGLLGLVLAVGLALGMLVGTESGSRWALAKVPGLEVADFTGATGRHLASQSAELGRRR